MSDDCTVFDPIQEIADVKNLVVELADLVVNLAANGCVLGATVSDLAARVEALEAKANATAWTDPPDLSARAKSTIDRALNPVGAEP